ncbi:MAG: hypothetical protein NTV63_05520 [Candidatus Woesearchaeota archaeon]|nr:hypothetical protein [Candidatus Woesearchaeota archaeon]
MEFKILNSKETREIIKMISEQWGCNLKDTPEYDGWGFIENNEERIFLVTRDIGRIEFSRLRANSAGLYFGELKNGMLRLSIEGSQIVGKLAKKNLFEMNYEQCGKWMKGEDIEAAGHDEISNDNSGFLIMKYQNNFLGSGRYKEGRIINFVPKTRRLKELC